MVRTVEKTLAAVAALFFAISCACVGAVGCASAYAEEATGRLIAVDSIGLRVQSLSAGDTFCESVEGVDLVFQVIDADKLTVRLGTGDGAGNALKDGVYPADHRVVVPASVEHEGETYRVKEIAASAFRVRSVNDGGSLSDYVGDVVVRADLDYVGKYAFGTWGADMPFSYRFEGRGHISRVEISAFRYCATDELVFPEGADIVAENPYPYSGSDDNLYGDWIHGLVYPLSYSGTVCNYLTALNGLYVKSPYSTIDVPEVSYLSVSLGPHETLSGHSRRTDCYAWQNTQASRAFLGGYAVKDLANYRAMAALSDWECPESVVPEGAEPYSCACNVEYGMQDGGTYYIAPKPTLECVDDEGGWTLEEGVDYTVQYFDVDESGVCAARAGAPMRPGAYAMQFVGNDKSAWGCSQLFHFSLGADISDAHVEFDSDATAFPYNGAPQSPAVSVSMDGVDYVAGLQYMVRYVDFKGNVSATEPTEPGLYRKRIISRTPWAGLDVEIPFQITQVDIASVEAADVALSGGAAKPEVVVRDAEGREVAPAAYKATYFEGDAPVGGPISHEGRYRVEVAGDGVGCMGEASADFAVVAADRALASARQVEPLAFTGEAVTPVFEVLDAGGRTVPDGSYAVAYADEQGCSVEAGDLVAAGTYTATVTAVGGSYAGSVSCEVVVDSAKVTADDVSVVFNRGPYDYIKSLDWAKLDGYDQDVQPRDKARVYLSAPIEPTEGDFTVKLDGEELVAGRDYEVTIDGRMRSDKDDQDAKVPFKVKLCGNYSGEISSADLEGAPTVTINKRIAHTVWHKGVLFSYAIDTDGAAVITGLGVDLTASSTAADLAKAFNAGVWGQRVCVPAKITDGGVTYEVKEICPNAFVVPRDGVNSAGKTMDFLNGATALEIEEGIQKVGAQAFSLNPTGSRVLSELTLHEGLRFIEPYAFSGGSVKIDELVIPASVETIGYAAFGQNTDNCSLTKLEFAEGSRFHGGSDEGIEMSVDDISGGVVRKTGYRRYGGFIVDGGGRGPSTVETSKLTSLTIPAQYTGAEALFIDFIHCTDVYWMADWIERSAATSLNAVAINLSRADTGGDVTVWGWDNAGTALAGAVDSNSSLNVFRPFAVLGDGYTYEHATGGPKTYPGNVSVGVPSVTHVAADGKSVEVDWDLQLHFANRKYKWEPVEGEDFTVSWTGPDGQPATSFSQAGVYTAKLEGNEVTCFGSCEAQVTVGTEIPADAQVSFAAADEQAMAAGFVYDGEAHEPAVASVTLPGAFAPLEPGAEYTVRYEDNVAPGTGRVIVEGAGGYFGSVVREFSIVVGAADQAAVDAAVSAVCAIGAVTSASGSAVGAARAAYDGLTPAQKALVPADVLAALADAEASYAKVVADAKAAAAAAAAKERAKAAASTVNTATLSAVQAKKASDLGVTTITLGPKVKKIAKGAFAGTKITTIVAKTKKLKKKSVKGSLKGSKVKTVKVQIGKKKVNKKYAKKYKKIFTKKNAGKKAKVKY